DLLFSYGVLAEQLLEAADIVADAPHFVPSLGAIIAKLSSGIEVIACLVALGLHRVEFSAKPRDGLLCGLLFRLPLPEVLRVLRAALIQRSQVGQLMRELTRLREHAVDQHLAEGAQRVFRLVDACGQPWAL